MKIKKINVLLAAMVGAGMILSGIASAAPESIFLEIQAKGKGYQAESDNPSAPGPGIVYTKSKHKLDAITFYAMCDRANGSLFLAYYVAAGDVWSVTGGIMLEAEESLLLRFPSLIQIYVDSDSSAVLSKGAMRVQFKLKEGTVNSAKLKSLAMSYWQTKDRIPEGNIQRFGAVKMKGKKIDPDELPLDVQDVFGLLP